MQGDQGPPRLLDRILHSAEAYGDRVAHDTVEGRMRYAALVDAARRLAGALRSGTGPVLVYGHKESGMLVGFLGCLLAGRPYVPLDVSMPLGRIERIARIAGATAVYFARPTAEEVRQCLRTLGIVEVGVPEVGGVEHPVPEDPERIAYIIFTSGSTGDPKGVPVLQGSLAHFVHWLSAEQRLIPGEETVLNQAPFSFDLSVMDLYLSLTSGGTLFSLTADLIARPRDLFARLYQSGLTVWVSTPSFVRFCLADPAFRAQSLPQLKRLLFCGETLPVATARALLERFPGAELWNTYGPTETTVAVTRLRIDETICAKEAVLPVGYPAEGMRVWAVAEDGRPVADGEEGELVIAGPQLSPGYLRRTDGPSGFGPLPDPDGGSVFAYRTGDRGHVAGGLVYCEGRVDRQVKLHGYRLELDEIEHRLRALPDVTDAAVLAVPREGPAEYLAAFIGDPHYGSDPEEDFARAQAIRQGLASELPTYAIPRVYRFVSALPLTANGKVDRGRLVGWLP